MNMLSKRLPSVLPITRDTQGGWFNLKVFCNSNLVNITIHIDLEIFPSSLYLPSGRLFRDGSEIPASSDEFQAA